MQLVITIEAGELQADRMIRFYKLGHTAGLTGRVWDSLSILERTREIRDATPQLLCCDDMSAWVLGYQSGNAEQVLSQLMGSFHE